MLFKVGLDEALLKKKNSSKVRLMSNQHFICMVSDGNYLHDKHKKKLSELC